MTITIEGNTQIFVVIAGVLLIIGLIALTVIFRTWRKNVVKRQLNDAMAEGWDIGYAAGVEDEWQAADYNIGASEPVSPNRQNPYRE